MAELNFNCPKEKATFKAYWDMFVEDIKSRENLKNSHLQQLRILCDMSVEYDELCHAVSIEGRTYESQGRNGTQVKLNPLVQQQSKVITEIRNYSKMLGLILVKDTKFNESEDRNDFD